MERSFSFESKYIQLIYLQCLTVSNQSYARFFVKKKVISENNTVTSLMNVITSRRLTLALFHYTVSVFEIITVTHTHAMVMWSLVIAQCLNMRLLMDGAERQQQRLIQFFSFFVFSASPLKWLELKRKINTLRNEFLYINIFC